MPYPPAGSWIADVTRADGGADKMGLDPLRAPAATEVLVSTLWAQRAVRGAGFDPGPLDGRTGRLTIAALSLFHESRGSGVAPHSTAASDRLVVSPEDELLLADAPAPAAGPSISSRQLHPPSVAASSPPPSAAAAPGGAADGWAHATWLPWAAGIAVGLTICVVGGAMLYAQSAPTRTRRR